MIKKSIIHRLTARLRKNFFWGSLLTITGNELENKNWIFILGCYNSGTTLLNQLLASHPSIGGLPDEGVMLTDQLVKPEDFGWRRMWWRCKIEMDAAFSKLANARRIKKHWSHFYPHGKEFHIEKSISNVCRIPFFEKEFQPAYFIHIVRNGYAVAEGIKRKAEIMPGNEFYEENTYPIDHCITQWVENLKLVEEESRKLQRFLEISYEELTEHPQRAMQRITDFLGVAPFPENAFQKEFEVHEKSSAIKNMNPSSFKRLQASEITEINLVAGEYLTKYGYSLI